jgi:hypothetical protein
MTRTALIATAAAALLAAAGCSSTNRIVGHNLTQAGHWYGELGITGDRNNITVQAGSRLTKLSVLGDGNTVTVEERCSLGKIELWGQENTVTVPDYLVVRIAQWGPANQVIRCEAGAAVPMLQLAADRAAEIPEQPIQVNPTPIDEPADEPGEQLPGADYDAPEDPIEDAE